MHNLMYQYSLQQFQYSQKIAPVRDNNCHESKTYSTESLDRHWSIREIAWCNLCCDKQGSKTFLLYHWANDFWKISSTEIISKLAIQTKERTKAWPPCTNHNIIKFIKPLITFIVYASITVFFCYTNKKTMMIFTKQTLHLHENTYLCLLTKHK